MSQIPTDRTKPLRGLVKSILPNSSLLLQGPKGKNGLPLERTLYLTGITYPIFTTSGETSEELFGFAAREFLKKQILGVKIEFFLEQAVGSHEYGSAYINGQDLAIGLLEAGLARVVLKKEGATLKPFNVEKYKEAEEKAKTKKAGIHGDSASLPKPRVTDQLTLSKLFPGLKNKTVKGIVEEYTGSAFTVYSEELQGFFKFHIGSITVSGFNYQNLKEAKSFVEEKLLQREVGFILERLDATANAALGEVKFEALDLTKELLQEGFAKLNQEAVAELDNKRFQDLKKAQDTAQEAKRRVWKDHKPQSKNSKKDDHTFNARVIEVHSGDCLTVQNVATNESKRLCLANLRAPAVGNPRKAEPEKPWAFESREFARLQLVGKKVRVELEYSKTIIAKDRDPEEVKKPGLTLEFGTVFLNDKNFSELLLENGLANVQMPRVDEEFTKYMKSLKEAEDKGKAEKKGQFSGKEKSVVKFNDLSLQKNAGKMKTFFQFIQGEKRMSGVVELILNGSRFKLRLNAHSTHIIFVLQGVKCLQNDPNVKEFQEYSNLALNYSKENLLQRDVEVEVEACDNKGNILGSIILNKKNYALSLLENGLAYVPSQSVKSGSKYQAQYEAAEKEAKKASVGIWKTGIKLNNEGEAYGAKPKELNEKTTLTCSEITDAKQFFFKDPKAKFLHQIENQLKDFNDDSEEKLKPPVKHGTPCVAVFLDDAKWYRARIEKHVKADKYSVFYVDYGNYDEVILDDIRKMPSKLIGIEPQARVSGLAYLNVPGLDHELGEEVATWLKNRIWNKPVEVNFVYQIKDKSYVVLRDLEEKDPKKTINSELIELGYAKLGTEVPVPAQYSHWMELEEAASGKGLGVWGYDDEDEDAYNEEY